MLRSSSAAEGTPPTRPHRSDRYGSCVEAEHNTNEQLERILPYLELRACRATPLSFIRGQLRVDALQARVHEATDAITQRSSTDDLD